MIPFLNDQDVDAAILLGGFAPSPGTIPMISVWQNPNICTSVQVLADWSLRAYVLAQRVLMRVSISRASLNVFLSKDSAEHCARMMPLDRGRTSIIPIGIDERFYAQADVPDREARSTIVVTISDLYRHKRVEMIIDAFGLLREEAPELRCVIAGRPVDEAYFEELKARVVDLRLQDRVEFCGGIDHSQAMSLYRDGLVYVTASRLETFGLTPIEAMASGLPVVAPNASALPEIGGEALMLVEKDSAEAFARAILLLCRDAREWTTRRDAGIERSQLYSWDRIASEYAERIERLLPQNNGT